MSTSAAAVIEPEATQAQAESFYRPGLDILRALAFLMVFVAHGLVWQLNKPIEIGAIARAGEFGVCIFFFLSSYLITELLLREKRDTGTILIRAFYVRRILRIWPLYFAVIAARCLYGFLVPTHAVSVAWTISLVLFFTNWYTEGHGYPPGFLFPLWSISLEEQFYLLWPWLVKYLSRGGLLAIASLVLGAAYVTLAWMLCQKRTLDPAIWVNSLVQFQFFALGTMLAIGLRGRVPHLGKTVRWGLFVAGLLCLRAAQAAVYVRDPIVAHDFAHIAPRFLSALAACLCLFFQPVAIALRENAEAAHLSGQNLLRPVRVPRAVPWCCEASTYVFWPPCRFSPLPAMDNGYRTSLHGRNRHTLLSLLGKSLLALQEALYDRRLASGVNELLDVVAAHSPITLGESERHLFHRLLSIGEAGAVIQNHVLALGSSRHGGGVTGVQEFARQQGANPSACLLQLPGICIPVELGAYQHAGVGIAVCEVAVIKVSEKPQGLALRRLLFRGMRIGSRFPLLRWRGCGRLLGEQTPMYQAGCHRDEKDGAQAKENRSSIGRI